MQLFQTSLLLTGTPFASVGKGISEDDRDEEDDNDDNESAAGADACVPRAIQLKWIGCRAGVARRITKPVCVAMLTA
jgi:hypothetical protein